MLQFPQGAEPILTSGEFRLPIDPEDGFVGEDLALTHIRFSLLVSNNTLRVFDTDGNHAVRPKKDYFTAEGRQKFRSDITVHREDADAPPQTRWPDNAMLAVEPHKDGTFTLWRMGIIFQGEQCFFVSQQSRYECFREGTAVVCPALEWYELEEGILQDIFTEFLSDLRPAEEYDDRAGQHNLKSRNGEDGVVKFFDPFKGFGVLETHQGSAYVNWRDVERPGSRLAMLRAGEPVRCEQLVRNTRGNLLLKAFGVRPYVE